jgi:nucleotide-binding universal stress UspA family protein
MTATEGTMTPRTPGEDRADGAFIDALCGVDGTRSSFTAVEQAAALTRSGGQLTLLAVTAASGAGVFRSAAIGATRAERALARAARIAAQAGVSATEVVDRGGPPATVILQAAAGHDLLALGAPAMSSLGGMLVGTVASQTQLGFTTPLLMARPVAGGERFAKQMLIASDGLDGSEEIAELAGRIALCRDARVTFVHTGRAKSTPDARRVLEQAETLAALIPGSVQTILESGGAADAILCEAAATGASLIVMGSRRRGGLHAFGSVSRSVVHAAPCSVLVVPPRGLPR